MSKKQNLGQFNTKSNIWLRPHIFEFIMDCEAVTVVDPFVGRGDLFSPIDHCFNDHAGYDIDPDLCTDMGWTWNNSLDNMPFHSNAIVVTNPPYLAKNSAARNDLESYNYFQEPGNEEFEDLYQIALHKVMEKYEKAVFIIPETYFQTEHLKRYLHSYTVIEENPFNDTDCPICVATFSGSSDFFRIAGNNYKIYKNDSYLFNRFELEDVLWQFSSHNNTGMTFNDPEGNLGLRGVDGVDPDDKIRFCKPEDLGYTDEIKESSRAITIINVNHKVDDKFIDRTNYFLGMLRLLTNDIILSPFKNNNKLGHRRRRLDFKWARKIIEKSIETIDK